MKLTHYQFRVLQSYWLLHHLGFSLSYYYQAYWLKSILLLVLFEVGVLLSPTSEFWGGITFGFAVALLVKTISDVVQLKSSWLLVSEITNWKRVEELLDTFHEIK